MASFNKYDINKVGFILKHNNRTSADTIHYNDDIDCERTVLNYHFKKGNIKDLHKRLSEVFSLDSKKKDLIVLGEIVVTMPKDVEKSDERLFFKAVYDFYAQDSELGEKNIVNAVVHKDEKNREQPHIHIDFVPVLTEELNYEHKGKKRLQQWKEEHAEEIEMNDGKIERLCCKDKINRQYLMTMHQKLSAFVEDRLGYQCEILNGATEHGNKTVLSLKIQSLKKQIEAEEKRLEATKAFQKEWETVLKIARDCGITPDNIGCKPLMEQLLAEKNRNALYRDILARNNYTFTNDDLEHLRGMSYSPVKSSNVNIYDGNLLHSDMENNAIVIIEMFNRNERKLPQQRYIDTDSDLQRQINVMERSINDGKKIVVKNSKISDKTYIIVRTDNEDQTAAALLELNKLLKRQEDEWKGRHIYMEKMDSDELEIARSILNKSQYNATYLTGDYNSDTDSRVKEIQKV